MENCRGLKGGGGLHLPSGSSALVGDPAFTYPPFMAKLCSVLAGADTFLLILLNKGDDFEPPLSVKGNRKTALEKAFPIYLDPS